MKKIILLMLSALFILAGCSNKNSSEANEPKEANEVNDVDTNFSKSKETNTNSSKTLKSLNGFLEYELPEGWENRGGDKLKGEIYIENYDIMLLIDYVEYSKYTPKEYTKYQQDTAEPEEANFILAKEDTFEDNGRKINLTIYEKQNKSGKSEILMATIEFDENKEAFLGVSATITENKNGINEVFDILNTIKFTGLKLNEERKFISEKEHIELTLQPGWKKIGVGEEISLYKEEGKNFLVNSIITGTDLPISIEEVFSKFELSNSSDKLEVYSEMNKEDLGDRIIISKAYKIDTGYLYYNFIDFKDSGFYVLSTYNVAIEGKFEDIKEELDKMTKSIKIKEGGEE